MRHNAPKNENSQYRIIAVDDEIGIIDSLSIFLKREGYDFVGVTDPLKAIEMVRNEHFDLMLLDFIMMPIHGDKVIEEIRKFNQSLYIILLTGHKDLAPPLETLRQYDIQGYCEKTDKFDQLMLLIESGIKSITQMKTIQKMNEQLVKSSQKLEKSYMESIEMLRYTVEAKDPYTRGHSERVSDYSVLLGEKLGLSEEELHTLKIGGLFHDIGKIGVPDTVLSKPGKLTDEEFEEIKKHPSIGAEILSNATIFADIIPIVKYHHERYDGKGYPDGLAGLSIPYLARIAAIADTYDAMRSKRPYRDALPLDIVKEEFRKNAGTQFDPSLVPVFLEIIETEYDKIEKIENSYYEKYL